MGFYDRVSVPGSKPETPMTNQPKYVHERNEVRRGEVALRRGEKPPPGVGVKGFGRKGQKKSSGKPEADNDAESARRRDDAPWRETSWTGSRGWGSGSNQQPWSATGAATVTWAATWSGSTWGANGENTTSSETEWGIRVCDGLRLHRRLPHGRADRLRLQPAHQDSTPAYSA